MNKKEIGKYLEKLRKAKGLNRTQAANRIGTIYKSILDWESGVMPSIDSLTALASLYDATVDDILECGKQITSEELNEKYPIFKPFDYNTKTDKKRDYYTPYQTQLIVVNNRLKELIMLFRKRALSRSEDAELRFLFTKMCNFSGYYYDCFDDNESKDKYLCFIEVLNEAKNDSKTAQEYYFEVRKYINVVNDGYGKQPYPEYAEPDKDSLKDQQFKSLENWEKDFYLAVFQNNDIIFDASAYPSWLKDYEQRYGKEFDKEKITKELIKYFINNGAQLNPWLFTFKKKKKISHKILDTLEDLYIEYKKPIFICYHNPNNEKDQNYKHAFVENNETNRYLTNFMEYYSTSFCFVHRPDPKKALDLFESTKEEEVVEYLYSHRNKSKEETEYRFKKAYVEFELKDFYKSRDRYFIDKEIAKKEIDLINLLEEKFNNGEDVFYEYELEDISKLKDFDHWKLMESWKNQLSYSQFMKKRDKQLTDSLLKAIDNLSLEEIRDKYFAKEEVEVKDE